MDGLPQLPDDLIIWKILPLLPSSVLVRCKCVCKLWHKTISSDTNFAENQLVLQKPGEINITDTVLSFTNSKENFEIDLSPFISDPHLVPVNSCDGLLVVASLSHNYFRDFSYRDSYKHGINGYYVINPIIQRYVKLPRLLVPFGRCAIHFVDGLNKYKLVGWNKSWNPLIGSPVFVLVLEDNIDGDGTENSWCMFYPPTPLHEIWDQPVVVNGWLYWIAVQKENNQQQVILAFNTKSIEFREVEIPDSKMVGTSYAWHLRMFGLKDYVVFCVQHHYFRNGKSTNHYFGGGKSCYNIWTVGDSENQVWTSVCRYKAGTCTHCEENSNNTAPLDLEFINNWSQPYMDVGHVNSLIWLDNKLG